MMLIDRKPRIRIILRDFAVAADAVTADRTTCTLVFSIIGKLTATLANEMAGIIIKPNYRYLRFLLNRLTSDKNLRTLIRVTEPGNRMALGLSGTLTP